LNSPVKNIDEWFNTSTANEDDFNTSALELFRFQYRYNRVYNQYCNLLKIEPGKVSNICDIPFLPISFFKTHKVVTTEFVAGTIFESSGTTKTVNSRHFVKDPGIYKKSLNNAFRLFYGDPAEWCILALLPSYLERNNSSLVMMADQLVQKSKHPGSGFYLNERKRLQLRLDELEESQQKTLLIGVSFALLDLAERFPVQLNYTTVMETGGMKGRRTEMTRQQLHEILCDGFKINNIHSEYSMTELLSQAYSSGSGIFRCPPWMKVLLREEDDPLATHIGNAVDTNTGAINIIDLANIYSCSFIATEDAGRFYHDGSFEVLGRLDNSDIRGCSLLSL
jgi:hypothetical protein